MFISQKQNDFVTLVQSLQFNNSFEEASTLVVAHLNVVQGYLVEFLSTAALPQAIRHELSALPAENILRLVASPYICELLMLWKDSSTTETIER